jgi:hypothetical protein
VQVHEHGRCIRVRIAGLPTEKTVREANDEVHALVAGGGGRAVLLDATQMLAPPPQVAWLQRDLLWRLEPFVRCAVVVADARCAFLARIAFGDANYRLFYNDLDGATRWLEGG